MGRPRAVPSHGLRHLHATTRNRRLVATGCPPATCRRYSAVPSRYLGHLLVRLVDTHGGDIAVPQRGHIGRFSWPALPETLMRSSLVIVLDDSSSTLAR